MGQSSHTEVSSLVSMLFRTFLNPLKFLMKILSIDKSQTILVQLQS